MKESLKLLQSEIGHTFRNPDLLREALTHKSYAAEWNVKYDNQRLEFFGDAVVQLVLTRYLFDRYPTLQEGDLTKIRSALVNQDSLAMFARSISLGDYLRLGKGETDSSGQDRDSTISDAFEALSAAIYLDAGYEKVETFILRVLEQNVENPLQLLTSLNPKGALQEYTQSQKNGMTPRYTTLSVNGPAHDPCYEAGVFLGKEMIATGVAQNRKNAEQKAAEAALKILKQREKESSGL